jgi:hypothetical protein
MPPKFFAERTDRMPPLERAASAHFVPSSVDEKARTIEVVMTTGEGVMRHPYWGGPFEGESYLEELEISEKSLRTERLDKDLPLQADHQRGIDSTLGSVGDWRIEDGKLIGVARFSDRNDQSREAFIGAKEGHLKDFSLGYRIHGYSVTKRDKDSGNAILATDLEPLELSLVAIPAETGANSRSAQVDHEMNTCQVRDLCEPMAAKPKPEPTMTEEEKRAAAARDAAAAAAAQPAPVSTGATPAEVQVQVEAARAEGAAAGATEARELVTAVDGLCGRMSIDAPGRIALLACASIEDARAMAIDLVFDADQAAGEISTASRAEVGTDHQREGFIRGFTNKIECELNPGQEYSEDGKRHAYRPLVDQLREMYPEVRDAHPMDVAKRASSGQFPGILATGTNRVLQQRFKEAPSNWGGLTRERKFKDFREVEMKRRTGSTTGLDHIAEAAEYKYAKFGEQTDSYRIKKYGKLAILTLEMIQDDDLGAFSDIVQEQLELAVSGRADLVWGLFTDNPTMGYDATTLFHANHGNIGATAATVSKVTLNEARLAMQKQTTPAGRALNLLPKYLCIPPDLWADADEMITQSITAATTATTNYWNGRLEIISESRLSTDSVTAWYLSAGATLSGPSMEHGTMIGKETPHMEREEDFKRDGIAFKIRDFFGVKAVEHRGLFYNAGV